MSSIRVAIIDDHELVRAGLSHLMQDGLGAEVVMEGADPHAVLHCDPLPDLLLLDVDLGDTRARPELVADLQALGCRVLIVSALASAESLIPLLEAGAAGFISKRESPEQLLAAARTVLDDGTWTSPEIAAMLLNAPVRPRLSPTQQRVLVLYASGMTLDSVARHLGMTVGTVSTHLKRARAKYAEQGRAMPSRVDLYREVRRDGLIAD